MKKNDLSIYGEYRIKEVNGIRQFEKDGTPIIGDHIKNVTLDQQTAKLLNKNAFSFGKVYVPVKEKEPEQSAKVQEAGENELNALRQKAKDLGVKNTHVMKEEKLIEKIKETENK